MLNIQIASDIVKAATNDIKITNSKKKLSFDLITWKKIHSYKINITALLVNVWPLTAFETRCQRSAFCI